MKKIFIFCLMALVMYSCNFVEQRKFEQERAKFVQERAKFIADSIAKRELFLADSIAKVKIREQEIADSLSKVKHINAVKKSIQLESYTLHSPNSADGCDMTIKFRNLSKQTIKYVVFICKYYNAVNDVVYCNIRDYSAFRGQVTGPIKYNETNWDSYYWECPIYNGTARKMEIIGIEIDYMDGTELNISKEEMKYVKGYRGRK